MKLLKLQLCLVGDRDVPDDTSALYFSIQCFTGQVTFNPGKHGMCTCEHQMNDLLEMTPFSFLQKPGTFSHCWDQWQPSGPTYSMYSMLSLSRLWPNVTITCHQFLSSSTMFCLIPHMGRSFYKLPLSSIPFCLMSSTIYSQPEHSSSFHWPSIYSTYIGGGQP